MAQVRRKEMEARAVRAGYEAFQRGMAINRNPFNSTSLLGMNWKLGWETGKEEKNGSLQAANNAG